MGDPSCVNGGVYYNSSSNQAKVCINSQWTAIGVPTVTSLPGSPANGDEVYYQFNRGDGTNAYWHLRYNSSSTYWDYVGGPSMFAEVTPDQNTTSTSYTNLATTGPTLTLPRTGDYYIRMGMRYFNSTVGAYGYMSPSFNGGTPTDADAIAGSGGGSIGDVTQRTIRKTGQSAVSVSLRYKVLGGTGFFMNRWIEIVPIRVQ